MATLEEIRALIRQEVRALIDPDGYRAGQQRIRDNYMRQLENELADFDLVDRDKGLHDEPREVLLQRKGEAIIILKRRIEDLDRALALGTDGNRPARRRPARPHNRRDAAKMPRG